MYRCTPFYYSQVRMGAKMPEEGLRAPSQYTNPEEEHIAIRERVGITDFTGMGEVDVKGKGVRKFLDEHCVNNISALDFGRIVYTTMLYENGDIIDDVTVYCFDEEHFGIVTSSAKTADVVRWLTDEGKGKNICVTDVSAMIGLLAVQGPLSRKMLSPLCKEAEGLKYFAFIKTSIKGIPVILSRTGFTGELGFEIYVKADYGNNLWEIIEEAGKNVDARFCGSIASVNSIALEKGFITVREYGDHKNPLEVGLDWSIKWEKPYFVGKSALEKIKAEGIKQKLMGFIMEDAKAVIPLGSAVFVGDKEAGKVTSAYYGYTLEKSLGLCFLQPQYANVGQNVHIKTDAGMLSAVIADKTFYDPEKHRIKM